MAFNRECVTCKFLEACSRTSTPKILTHYVCDLFQEALNEEEIVKARCDIINKFGVAGLKALAPCQKETTDG